VLCFSLAIVSTQATPASEDGAVQRERTCVGVAPKSVSPKGFCIQSSDAAQASAGSGMEFTICTLSLFLADAFWHFPGGV